MRYHPVERRRTISTVAPAGITSFTALLVLTFARRFSAVVVVAVAAAADRGWKTIAAAAVDRSSAATMNRLANLAQPIATTVARGVPTTSTTTELPVTAGRSSSRARCGDATMHPVPDHRLAAIAPEANRDSGISMRSMRDSRPSGRIHPDLCPSTEPGPRPIASPDWVAANDLRRRNTEMAGYLTPGLPVSTRHCPSC